MIVTCKECDSSFNVEDRLIKDDGSKVRCSQCQLIFTAYPPSLPAKEEPVATAPPGLETGEKAVAVEVEQPELAPPASPAEESETGAAEVEVGEEMDFQEDFARSIPIWRRKKRPRHRRQKRSWTCRTWKGCSRKKAAQRKKRRPKQGRQPGNWNWISI